MTYSWNTEIVGLNYDATPTFHNLNRALDSLIALKHACDKGITESKDTAHNVNLFKDTLLLYADKRVSTIDSVNSTVASRMTEIDELETTLADIDRLVESGLPHLKSVVEKAINLYAYILYYDFMLDKILVGETVVIPYNYPEAKYKDQKVYAQYVKESGLL